MADIFGTPGDDVRTGGSASDTIYGDATGTNNPPEFGADTLSGANGDDEIFGWGGADTLNGGDGSDDLYGGDGDDTLDGSFANDVLFGENGDDTLRGGDSGDLLTGDEGADTLEGGAGFDSLVGGIGNDALYGGDNEDTLYGEGTYNGGFIFRTLGGPSDDILDGQGGNDTASYFAASAAVIVRLPVTIAQDTLGGGVDTLIGIENITGSSFDDILIGDTGRNTLSGADGADALFGGLEADRLFGGDGDDTLRGEDGNDLLVDSRGDDTLDGGSGQDEVEYRTTTVPAAGVTVNLLISGPQNTGGAGVDTLISIEKVVGGDGNDTITGNELNNVLTGARGNDAVDGGEGGDRLIGQGDNDALHGADGNDELFGGFYLTFSSQDGDDVLDGGAGDDTLDGGSQSDTASYASALAAVGVDLSIAVFQDTGAAGLDKLISIENLAGSFYNDTLIGNGGSNTLSGENGDDALRGADGDDILDGGAGFGDDVLDGAGGDDTASYASSTGGVHVSLLAAGAPQNTILSGNDTLISIENLTGSPWEDTLTGDAGDNVLAGGLKKDTLTGGAGNDTYILQDVHRVGVIPLRFFFDTVSEAPGEGIDRVQVQRSGSFGGGYTLAANVEHGSVTGTETFTLAGNELNNSLSGNSAANGLSGFAGDDSLFGGDGIDTLIGGDGDDSLNGGSGIDTANYVTATSAVVVSLLVAGAQNTGGAGTDTLSQIENLIGSDGNDTLTGDGQANVLEGGLGNDRLNGGAGMDTASYALAGAAVTVNLALAGFQNTGGAGSDMLSGVENLVGSGGADRLTGDGGVNALDGGIGDDILNGGAGNDVMTGGLGNDFFFVDGAGDLIDERSGGGTDRVFTRTSHVLGFADIEILSTDNSAGTSAINLTGNSFANTIFGNAGANTLDGSFGADALSGLGGNDFYHVDNALDVVNESSGAGSDRVFAAISYALKAGSAVEILSTVSNLATDAINLSGNELGNAIFGNAGANTLDGRGGADSLNGLGGDDFYFVDNALDVVNESVGAGADRLFASVSYALKAGSAVETFTTTNHAGTAAINLTGNDLSNLIYGNAGANTLDGRGGADNLQGLGGDDWYYVDNAADRVVEAAAGGSDRVLAAVSFSLEAGSEIELLATTNNAGAAAINLTGNSNTNQLLGNAGANTLDGRGGADILQGLGGNDWYTVDNAGDRAVEALGKGVDQVFASVSFALEVGSEIEYLRTTNDAGMAAINLAGNERGNIVYGNAGSNRLDGKGGADIMIGRAGDDFFHVDSAADRAVEAAGGGADRVLTSLSFTLEAGSEIETLTTTNNAGTTAMNLTGNAFANVIVGNAGQNIINGGLGADTLLGLGGPDHFLFNTALGATNVDAVRDFDVVADFIRLENAVFSALAAGGLPGTAFRVGASAADASDRIVYNSMTGALIYDANGNAAGGATQFATLSAGLALTSADFIVV